MRQIVKLQWYHWGMNTAILFNGDFILLNELIHNEKNTNINRGNQK